MSYDAKVISVMIASPGDVIQERQIVREVIGEWNIINSRNQKLVLLPVGWETHASPEMGDRPQGIINKQVLKDCDLLIAIFWTRIGSPTGKEASGSIEEIEEHVRLGKPAMLYFSSLPVEPFKVDKEQYTALEKYKSEMRSRGLVEEFKEHVVFRDKLRRQLSHAVDRNFSSASSEAIVPNLSEEAWDLLLEAGSDSNGTIRKYRVDGSLIIETNGRNFVTSRDSRVEARWWRATAELEQQRLIEDREHKGDLFFLTQAGQETLRRILHR